MCWLPLKWSQFLCWLHCNQLPEIGYTVSSRNPAVLKAVWYLNKQVICWGAETLFRALHGSGVFVTRLGFYYTQATGRVLCFLNKMTSFLELCNSSFSFSSPPLKSHFFPEYSTWKLSPYWQKLFSKFRAACCRTWSSRTSWLSHAGLCHKHRYSAQKFPMRGGFKGNLPCTFLSITCNLFIEEGFAHMCHMTAVEVGEKKIVEAHSLLPPMGVSRLGLRSANLVVITFAHRGILPDLPCFIFLSLPSFLWCQALQCQI